MNREEIEKRIEHCEMMEQAHREVGNTKSANRFNNEKYKWEKLLQKLDPKKDKELRTYKIGYYNLNQALNEIREYIAKDIQKCTYGQVSKYQDILQIIDKVLGDEK